MTLTTTPIPLSGAIRGLLDGWIGPVEIQRPSGAWESYSLVGYTTEHGICGKAPGVFNAVFGLPHRVRLDPSRIEVLLRAVAWLAERERCDGCDGRAEVGNHEQTDACPFCVEGDKRHASGSKPGWTRPPTNAAWLLPHPFGTQTPERAAILVTAQVARSVAGMGPIRGVLGAWTDPFGPDAAHRPTVGGERILHCVAALALPGSFRGWRTGAPVVRGSETGDAGKDAADGAAIDQGFALLSPDNTLTVAVPGDTDDAR